MKLNWGTGITIFIVLFVGHILFLVFQTTRVTADLQAEDYYEQEINYQDRIEAIGNTNALSSSFTVSQDKEHVYLHYPQEFGAMNLDGNIELFKPDNASLDQEIPLNQSDLKQLIQKKNLVKGWCVLRVNGIGGDRPYYFEERIFVN